MRSKIVLKRSLNPTSTASMVDFGSSSLHPTTITTTSPDLATSRPRQPRRSSTRGAPPLSEGCGPTVVRCDGGIGGCASRRRSDARGPNDARGHDHDVTTRGGHDHDDARGPQRHEGARWREGGTTTCNDARGHDDARGPRRHEGPRRREGAQRHEGHDDPSGAR